MADDDTPKMSIGKESPMPSAQGMQTSGVPSIKLTPPDSSYDQSRGTLHGDQSRGAATSRPSNNSLPLRPNASIESSSCNSKQLSSARSLTDTARVSHVSRRSRSGADLLRGDPTEWWGGTERSKSAASSQVVDIGAQGTATDHASVLRTSVEWWRDVTTNEEHLVDIKEGWWGAQPDILQGDGPQTGLCQRGCFAPLRHLTSRDRNRYQIHGFDLDLTYITSRVIAMGFPAAGKRTMYRNPRTEVAKFLRWRHNDHFRIYNLCIESKYIYNGFPDQTKHFPCPDHCPLSLPMMLEFCKDAEEWLLREAENVVLVHCKAGKGRSGTLICSLLVYSGAVSSAYEALRWFAKIRGGKRQGVTIPSQIRFLAMFERWLYSQAAGLRSDPMAGFVGKKLPLRLKRVRLGPVKPSLLTTTTATSGKAPQLIAGVKVGISNRTTFASKVRMVHWFDEQIVSATEDYFLEVFFDESIPKWDELDGVIHVVLRKLGGGCCGLRPVKLTAAAWWCHSFLETGEGELLLDVPKPCIDTLAKDVWKSKHSPKEFRLLAAFEDLRDTRELSCILERAPDSVDGRVSFPSEDRPPAEEGRSNPIPPVQERRVDANDLMLQPVIEETQLPKAGTADRSI